MLLVSLALLCSCMCVFAIVSPLICVADDAMGVDNVAWGRGRPIVRTNIMLKFMFVKFVMHREFCFVCKCICFVFVSVVCI